MRHVIIALALAASPVSADETTRPEAQEQQSASEWCALVAGLAEDFMSARQSGVSLQKALDIVADNAGPIRKVSRLIVLDAWEQPRYGTEAAQQTVIGTFRDELHLECIRGNE